VFRVQIFAVVDPEAADVSETPDAAGKNLLMSRRHVWQDIVLRQTHDTVKTLDTLRMELEKRAKDGVDSTAAGGKRRRHFEEYQMQQWALASMDAFAAETRTEHDKMAAESRDIAAKKAVLEQDIAYGKVSCARTHACSSKDSTIAPVRVRGCIVAEPRR
jgi:hypothetical protein